LQDFIGITEQADWRHSYVSLQLCCFQNTMSFL
jgi:hypothetical protein